MGTFKLPDLGEGLAEAEILEWHVKPGDHVLVDQPMVSVETAKAVVEVPVPFSGTVTALHGAVGDVVATGAPLIDFDSGTVVGSMPATSEDEFVESATVGLGRPTDDARARAVPVARAVAKRLGLDLGAIEGSGADGLIRLDDVLAHANIGGPRAPAGLAVPAGASAEPLRGARRAMAHSMSMSRDQVSGSTVCDDADIHGWTRRGDYMLRLIRAMIAACSAEPALNAWYDTANNSRILLEPIDLAMAVDTPGGLIVPVLRNIRNKTPDELRAAIAAQKEADAVELRYACRPLRHTARGAPGGCDLRCREGAAGRGGRGRQRRRASTDAAVIELRPSLHHRRRGLPIPGGRDCRFRRTRLALGS